MEALWQLQLPVGIRAHVSNMEFSHATYKQVFEAADRVFMSSKQVSVAAMARAPAVAAMSPVDLDETQAAFTPQNQPSEVAAFKSQKNKNKKNKGQGNKNQKPKGQKHSSVPDSLADKMCDRHFRHGVGAWYCTALETCPWKDKTSEKQ